MADLKQSVREQYEAFYLMTLSAAFLNSAAFGEFHDDAGKVLSFIGSAYGLDAGVVSDFSGLILGDMMKIGLVSDYHALSAIDDLSDRDRDNLVYYEIKGRALEEVNRSNRRGYFQANSRLNQDVKVGMKYESFHHAYDPVIRFEALRQQAVFGDLHSTRQLAILYALAIGTGQDYGKAKMYLERCVMWGDVCSTALLQEVCSRGEDEEGAREFRELYRLEKAYLEDGVIELPKGEAVADTVRERYLCIALIKHYLVVQGKMGEIDIAFLNALSQPGLSLKARIRFISQYKDSSWKNSVIGGDEGKHIGLWGNQGENQHGRA